MSRVLKEKGIQPKIRSILYGEQHPLWKGDRVSYSGLHYWVGRSLGKPKFCEHCGTKTAKKYEWANLSREYKRDTNDWIRLCKSCHVLFDDVIKKSWIKRRVNDEVIAPIL